MCDITEVFLMPKYHAVKAYRGCGGEAPRILNLGTIIAKYARFIYLQGIIRSATWKCLHSNLTNFQVLQPRPFREAHPQLCTLLVWM
jgi:hypothetical protein